MIFGCRCGQIKGVNKAVYKMQFNYSLKRHFYIRKCILSDLCKYFTEYNFRTEVLFISQKVEMRQDVLKNNFFVKNN